MIGFAAWAAIFRGDQDRAETLASDALASRTIRTTSQFALAW